MKRAPVYQGALLVAGGVIAGIALGWSFRAVVGTPSGRSRGDMPVEEREPDRNQAAATVTVVPGVKTHAVDHGKLHPVLPVSGRLTYDETRYVDVRASTEGVVRRVLVKPGDAVQPMQPLAWLSSPEVGNARAVVMRHGDELALALRKFQWDHQAFEHASALIDAIEQRRPIAQLEGEFRDQTLGDAREKLTAAYARRSLAESLLASAKPLAEAGSMPTATLAQRQSERDTADAALRGLCEQVRFDAQRRRDQSQVELDDARRSLDVARQRVAGLLGYEESDAGPREDDSNLSEYAIRSPARGTIEHRAFAPGSRVGEGDVVFSVADTSRLWVRAEIRERDWLTIRLATGDAVEAWLPGAPEKKIAASLLFLGRAASPDSNTIPLIAAIDNPDRMLRPGMFARLALPLADDADAILVPESAIVRHEGKAFVFVRRGDGAFARRDVECGRIRDGTVAVVRGLNGGEDVATEGTFLLKSALLLEKETE